MAGKIHGIGTMAGKIHGIGIKVLQHMVSGINGIEIKGLPDTVEKI